jgi:hypothetical protein
VRLTGKTVMPAIVDAHTHLSQTREALTDDLKRRAYYGVGAAMSLGRTEETYHFKSALKPYLPRRASARRVAALHHRSRVRTDAPYWISTEAEARKAVQELAWSKGGYRQDLGRRPQWNVQEAEPGTLPRRDR